MQTQHQMTANFQTKPTDLCCETVCKLQSCPYSLLPFIIISEPIAGIYCTMYAQMLFNSFAAKIFPNRCIAHLYNMQCNNPILPVIFKSVN